MTREAAFSPLSPGQFGGSAGGAPQRLGLRGVSLYKRRGCDRTEPMNHCGNMPWFVEGAKVGRRHRVFACRNCARWTICKALFVSSANYLRDEGLVVKGADVQCTVGGGRAFVLSLLFGWLQHAPKIWTWPTKLRHLLITSPFLTKQGASRPKQVISSERSPPSCHFSHSINIPRF